MRLKDIIGGYKMPLNNEETKLYDDIQNKGSFDFEDLSDREKEVIYGMYKKRMVNITDDGIIKVKEPSLSDILW